MTEEAKKLTKAKFNKLLKEIANGKQSALEALHTASVGYVYSVAASIVNYDIAQEVVNDVYLKIWQIAPTLTTIENPLGWLYIVTSNTAKDRVKQEKQCVEIFDIPREDKNIENLFVKEAFLSYISVLSEDEQLIMILYYVKDLTFKSIAKELKKPLSTVCSTFYRALKKIGQKIEKI